MNKSSLYLFRSHLQNQTLIFRNNYKFVILEVLHVSKRDNANLILIVYNDDDGNRYRRKPNRNTLLQSVYAPRLDTPFKPHNLPVPDQCDLVDLASR